MNIPLINSNSKQDINTSLIAIRNAINELARVKESASVEDLQRQINIINQQIANFNSEFSAINTHLNTIDTNILNLQPVDTVASGNLHSVTSNAVANMLDRLAYNYYNRSDTPINVLDVIKTMPLGKTSVLRIGGITSGTPYGDNVNTDFYYVVFRLPERDDFIRVIAHDVRGNVSFENALVGNSWVGWYRTQPIIRFGDTSPILTPNELLDWARIEFRNGIVCLYARFANYQTQHTFADGDIIGRLKPEYYPTSGRFPVNVHNFSSNQDHLLWIGEDGYIKIYGIGSQTKFYDFYISATYEI